MVLSKHTTKDMKMVDKRLEEILDSISTLNINVFKKTEIKKIDKINKKIIECKDIIVSKETVEKHIKNMTCYNIYIMDINNLQKGEHHLNILDDNVKDMLDTGTNKAFNNYGKVWNKLDKKIKLQYSILSNNIHNKEDYYEMLKKDIKSTPKQKKKTIR